MKNQNYKNHNRLNPLFHGVLFAMIAVTFLLAGVNLIQKADSDEPLQAGILIMISIITVFLFFFIRFFTLKLQERVIRSEENLRHYILTGKQLDHRLRTSQIAALRFSPDSEFPDLCQSALTDHLSAEDIKKRITKWRGDYYRI
jgi:Na+/melibiose symporter-like transporter